jgi:hypothetical protein
MDGENEACKSIESIFETFSSLKELPSTLHLPMSACLLQRSAAHAAACACDSLTPNAIANK